MSKQLAVSAALSIFAMAAVALLGTESALDDPMQKGATAAAAAPSGFNVSALADGMVPG